MRPPDLLAPTARTDYRALEPGRTTLGQWDLQYTTGPRAAADAVASAREKARRTCCRLVRARIAHPTLEITQ